MTKYFLRVSARSKDQGVNIKEWKLIYSPENSVLENLVNTVSKSLKLDGSVGVKTSNDIAQVMVNRKLVAGIEFEHPAVNIRGVSSQHQKT